MLFAHRSHGKDINPSKARSPSDHYDGKRFFNPTLPKGFTPSRQSTLKMLREPRSRWPAWVENKGVPRLNETLAANEVAITFVNHATFLIQTVGISILTDPVWSERASPFRRIGPKRVRKPGAAFEDLPTIDIVLLSHNHYDHLDVATLTRLRQRSGRTVLAAAGDTRIVGSIGFKDVRELDWWDKIQTCGKRVPEQGKTKEAAFNGRANAIDCELGHHHRQPDQSGGNVQPMAARCQDASGCVEHAHRES
jgi:hypothetical protein